MLCCAVLQVPLPRPPADCPPVFVLGGEDDKVLDVQAYQELARCEGGGGACLFIHSESIGSYGGLPGCIRTDMASHFYHVVQLELVGFSQSHKGLKYGSPGIEANHCQLFKVRHVQ